MPMAAKESMAAHPNEWCMNKPQAIALNTKGISTSTNGKDDDVINEDEFILVRKRKTTKLSHKAYL